MEEKYTHKVNLMALQKETGMSLKELASLVGIGSNVIYKWQYNHNAGSRPSYEAIVKLIEAGATVETLFEVEYKGGVKVVEKPISITDADISAFLQRAADALKNNH